MTRQTGKETIHNLVNDFEKNEQQYMSKNFQETETRSRFIDPFFTALGWDFHQTGIARKFWDVHREFSQRDNSTTKKPDYAFRIKDGLKYKEKFFVEAKAPWVDLTGNIPVFQAKRYAFSSHGKTPIVILTDFQTLRVFNGLEKPVYENPLQGLIKGLDLEYHAYLDTWDSIWDVFSKEAVTEGSIERLIGKVSRNTKSLDDEFLSDISALRETLARNVALRNKGLSVDHINETIQRILDRLIFIRNLEDREIKSENTLLSILKVKENIYLHLIPLFRDLDAEFNGLLFKEHFSETVNIDDPTIKTIIKQLCPPHSPYEFDMIEPEILGRIYERFLGSKIRLTDNLQAKMEEKPEVRHAGGVYYTPQYVVDYIVENTVGVKINGKSPDEIEPIKICDPACGSGSFLLGAFHYLIEYHRKWYACASQAIQRKYRDDFFANADNEVQLTLKKKAEILKNNIFGVDIDREATEVAIMSLYLKILDEGYDKGQGELFIRGHILPDMAGNIKCGNSLIDRKQLFDYDFFGDPDINPFDWYEFNSIGFDVIIGNPPYIRIQEMQEWAPKTVKLYRELYKASSAKNYDIYVIFIEKALSLLSPAGLTGMILPNKFMQQEYGEMIRSQISTSGNLYKLVNFKDFQVFKGATTYTCLLFLSKEKNTTFNYAECKNADINVEFNSIDTFRISATPWILHSEDDLAFFDTLNLHPKLSIFCDNIFVGVQTSADKVFILEYEGENNTFFTGKSTIFNASIQLEKKWVRHIISGTDVKKYLCPEKRQLVIFPYDIVNGKPVLVNKKVFEEKSPKVWNYLLENKKVLENREKGKFKGEGWYQFGRNQNISLQDKAKICVPRLVQEIQAIYDETGAWCLDNVDVGGVILKKEYQHLNYYIVGLLNSNLLSKYLSKISTPFRGGFWSCNRQYLEQLPIVKPTTMNQADIDKIQVMVQQIIELKNRKEEKSFKDAVFLEEEMEKIVERLYGNK
ncbi:MAG: Eco57I restriction-modification methylase domain-containing protein [Spirochaetaceae bacterium]|nr:Eco57I restriction-modification methylase domain-containing protein [Spirochaetaceae bacterium]